MSSGMEHVKQEMAARQAVVSLSRMVHCPTSPAAIEGRLRRLGGYVGQDDAVAALCLGLAVHARRIQARLKAEPSMTPLPRMSHLVIGPTGAGKSYLVRQLTKHGLGGDPLPYSRHDMNRITEAGYYGGDVDAIATAAIAAAGGDQAVAEASGVIFCDEVDKLRSCGTSQREVGGHFAQAALLDLVEGQGMTVDRYGPGPDGKFQRSTIQFNPHGLWVIGAGAFSGLTDIVRRTRKRRTLGFGAQNESPMDAALEEEELLRQVEPEHLVEFGILPELCSRFTEIVVLGPLRASTLKAILELDTPNSPLPQWRQIGRALGVELRWTDRLLDAIAAEAETKALGARGLAGIVSRTCRRALREVPGRFSGQAGVPICRLDLPALVDGQYEMPRPRRSKVVGPTKPTIESPKTEGGDQAARSVAGGG